MKLPGFLVASNINGVSDSKRKNLRENYQKSHQQHSLEFVSTFYSAWSKNFEVVALKIENVLRKASSLWARRKAQQQRERAI